jgi:hypothetical protein
VTFIGGKQKGIIGNNGFKASWVKRQQNHISQGHQGNVNLWVFYVFLFFKNYQLLLLERDFQEATLF